MKVTHVHTRNTLDAYIIAFGLVPDAEIDESATAVAKYKTYRSKSEYYDYICDLYDRLEVNRSDGSTINIWIDSHKNI